MRHRPFVALISALAVLAVACSDDGGSSAEADGPGETVELVASLRTYDSCDALLDELKATALERVGPYGLEGDPYGINTRFGAEDGIAVDEAAPAAESVDASGGPAPDQVSGTNVQEAGVDEPDLLKVDPERMVVVIDGRLTVIDLTGEPEAVGSLGLPDGYDHEVLVDGETALVLSNGDPVAIPLDDAAEIAPALPTTGTILTQVDLSDPTAPEVVAELRLDSRYLSARRVGATVRVAVSSAGPDLPFVVPQGAGGEDLAEETNRRVVEESTIEQWVPGWAYEDGGTVGSTGRLDDCERIHVPTDFAGLGMVSVLTVDLEQGLDQPDATSVVGAGETVYATADHLYVATERFPEPEDVDEPSATTSARPDDDGLVTVVPEWTDSVTAIHRFSTGDTVTYDGSGEVEGRLLNQFALSEHDGILRAASTRGAPFAGPESDSLVTTLELEGETLVERGRVEDLGRGEQIFAVRFIGTTGYVVTFRQTDPLYVVDLRDPAAPAVTGELKILGYSAYLHPVDETTLLGVGQDADEDGRTTGTQVSLFDVSDPTAPSRTAQFTVPDAGSEVEFDHRAFLWWEPTGTAVVPVERYSGAGPDSAALVLAVDPGAATIDGAGRVDHERGSVRRSAVIGDVLATVDASTVVFSDLETLDRLAEVTL